MDFRNLRHLADVALSRGAPANQHPNQLTNPTPSIATERLPAFKTLRRSSSMPHINTFFQQNNQSPPPLYRSAAPQPPVHSVSELHDVPPQSVDNQFSADLIEQFSALFARIGLGIHQLAPQSTSLPFPQPSPQLTPIHTSQLTIQSPQSSPPSTLALSE